MEKLIINHFGPIKHAELDVQDILLFIGPNAGGKSTISKLLYFFRNIPEVFWNAVVNEIAIGKKADFYAFFMVEIENNFLNTFMDITWFTRQESKISYLFESKISFSVTKIGSNLEFEIQDNDALESLKDAIRELSEAFKPVRNARAHALEDWKILWNDWTSRARLVMRTLFGNFSAPLFIPVGKSTLLHLPVDTRSVDAPTQEFLKEMRFLSGWRMQSTAKTSIENRIQDFLKARYKYDNADKLEILDIDTTIFLRDAASGQKENALFMEFIMFLSATRPSKNIFHIEEPEIHLYPENIKKLVEIFAAYINLQQDEAVENKKLTITTHSPYILSAFNNLLYAYQVGQKNPNLVEKVLPHETWINPKRLGAYFVADGGIRSIMDEELQLIKAEEIDSASRKINEEYDQLLNIEFGN